MKKILLRIAASMIGLSLTSVAFSCCCLPKGDINDFVGPAISHLEAEASRKVKRKKRKSTTKNTRKKVGAISNNSSFHSPYDHPFTLPDPKNGAYILWDDL